MELSIHRQKLQRFVEYSDSTRQSETVMELSIHRQKLKHHSYQSTLSLLIPNVKDHVVEYYCRFTQMENLPDRLVVIRYVDLKTRM
jgi:hypothetical protein